METASRFNASLQTSFAAFAEQNKSLDDAVTGYLRILDGFGMILDGCLARLEDRRVVECIDRDRARVYDNIDYKHRKYAQRWERLDRSYVYQEMEVAEHLQEWWKEATSGEHLVKKKQPLEYLQNIKSRGFHIPSEIMSNIYSFASLETCVALRQVNKAWYSVFQQSDVILADKVQQRNPFIRPGDGDLCSWRDCALVFVARLKWEYCEAHEKIDEINFLQKPPKTHTVIGTELEFNEKLPENFTSFFGDHALDVAVCLPMETWDRGTDRSYQLNTWTLETKQVDRSFHVVSTSAERNVIMKDGVEISLPGILTPPQDPSQWNVHVGCNMVVISMEVGGTLILPRDNPVYEKGFHWLEPDDIYEAGELSVIKETSWANHFFVDFSTRNLMPYSHAVYARPRALYNGLVWFCMEKKKALVPTFKDYESPGKLYFKRERIICEVEVGSGFDQGHKPHGTAQFLVTGNVDSDVHIVDLATGEITLVTCPYGWQVQAIHLLGFVDGKFSARCVSEESAFKYRAQMLAERGLR